MKNIRITIVRNLANIKIAVNRFVNSIRISLHHIDHATSRCVAFLKLEAKMISINIENAIVNVGFRFAAVIEHIDHDKSFIGTFHKLEAKINSIDHSKDQLAASLSQFTSITHVDINSATLNTMLVYPTVLGDLTDLTLGVMSNMTMGELNFTEIHI